MVAMGERIRRMRVDRGWTQEELAKMTDSGEKYISALERGRRNPGPKLITELCNAFSITEQELRFGLPDAQGLDQSHAQVTRMLLETVSPLTETEQLEWIARIRRWIEAGRPE